MHVVHLQIEVIINLVDNDGESEPFLNNCNRFSLLITVDNFW